MTFRILPTVATLLLSGAAAASEAAETFSLGAGVTTLGPSVEAHWQRSDQFRARALLAFPVEGGWSNTRNGIDYDYTFRTGGYGVLLDWHPTGNGFRISGGLFDVGSSLDVDAVADSSQTIRIGGYDYSDVKVEGNLTPKHSVAPAFAIGYSETSGGWEIGGEIGAIFIGGSEARLRQTSGQYEISDEDLRAEEDRLEDLYGLGAYPYAGLSVTYRF